MREKHRPKRKTRESIPDLITQKRPNQKIYFKQNPPKSESETSMLDEYHEI